MGHNTKEVLGRHFTGKGKTDYDQVKPSKAFQALGAVKEKFLI